MLFSDNHDHQCSNILTSVLLSTMFCSCLDIYLPISSDDTDISMQTCHQLNVFIQQLYCVGWDVKPQLNQSTTAIWRTKRSPFWNKNVSNTSIEATWLKFIFTIVLHARHAFPFSLCKLMLTFKFSVQKYSNTCYSASNSNNLPQWLYAGHF